MDFVLLVRRHPVVPALTVIPATTVISATTVIPAQAGIQVPTVR